MKQPTPSDFIVEVKESSVSVIFNPSNSDYTFHRLADAEDIARDGPLSRSPNESICIGYLFGNTASRHFSPALQLSVVIPRTTIPR